MDHIKKNIVRRWSIGVMVFDNVIRDSFANRLLRKVGSLFLLVTYIFPSNDLVWFLGSKLIVIVSDIRRKTDIEFFRSHSYNIKTIRINASQEVRKARGWTFQNGIDDVQSECDLDDFKQWDLVVHNDGAQEEAILDQILALLRSWTLFALTLWRFVA